MQLLLHTTLFTLLSLLSSSYCDPSCRNQCGQLSIRYPFGIDDGCGAPQFRHMFTCNGSSESLFFITPNGNYKVEAIDYKEQTMTVFDPDMSTCTILQPHHDVTLSDIQYAVIPPSADTVFALLNCSVDSPVLHRFKSYCIDHVAGHSCQELYSSCSSFRTFTTGSNNDNFNSSFYIATPGAGEPGTGFGSQPASSPPPGFGFGGVPVSSPPPGLGYGGVPISSPPPGFGSGGSPVTNPPVFGSGSLPISNPPPDFGSGGVPISNSPPGFGYGGLPSSSPPPGLGYGGLPSSSPPPGLGLGSLPSPSSSGPPCCFTEYSTVKVMSMDILDCSHFTSFYNADKLKGISPPDWSYGMKFSYSVPKMGCERCQKSGGSCGYDTMTEALLCLCSTSNNSTMQCGTGDMDASVVHTPSTILQIFIIVLQLFLLCNIWLLV